MDITCHGVAVLFSVALLLPGLSAANSHKGLIGRFALSLLATAFATAPPAPPVRQDKADLIETKALANRLLLAEGGTTEVWQDGGYTLSRKGDEFQANTETLYGQEAPVVKAFSDGSYIAAWHSSGQDGSYHSIHAQRYFADGTKDGVEFQVNTETTSSQSSPTIIILNDDKCVIAWSSFFQDTSFFGVYAQMYDANGNTLGSEFQVNTWTIFSQHSPDGTALSNGGFVLTWMSFLQDGSGYGVYAQRYDANGNAVGSEYQVNTTTSGSQTSPSATATTTGYLIVWASYLQDGSGFGIFGQFYDLNGNPLGGEFQINTTTVYSQRSPCAITLADGTIVVIWSSNWQDGSEYGIFGQRYDINGNPIGGEFQISTEVNYNQDFPRAAPLITGGWVVVWHSENQDGSFNGVFGQVYDKNGNMVGSEFQINSHTLNDQEYAYVIGTLDGFIVVWESYLQDGSYDGIYGQYFILDTGAPTTAPTSVPTSSTLNPFDDAH